MNRTKIRKNKYKKIPAVKKGRRRSGFNPLLKLNPVPVLTTAGVLSCFAALTYMLILVYSLIIQSSVFGAKTLMVSGNSRLNENTVLRQADIYPDRNIFDINLEESRKRLILHPWIKKAEVIREMPDTITIRIVEHIPVAIVDIGTQYLINTDGDIFKHYAGESDTLPMVTGMMPKDFNVSGTQNPENGNRSLDGLMNLLSTLKGIKNGILSSNVKRIAVDRDVGITILADTGIKRIRLGYGNYRNKIDRLNDVVEILGKKLAITTIDTIDLNNINRIVVKPVLLEAQV